MSVSLTRRPMRYLVVGLVALLAGLTVTAVAQGWRRPSDNAYSSPEGGDYRVCRDGIRFQAVADQASPGEDPPSDPTRAGGFGVYSPPPIDPLTRELIRDPQTGQIIGTIIAEGPLTLALQTPPFDSGDGRFWFYLTTHTQRWSGGQLLEPSPDSIWFSASSGGPITPDETDDVEDCFLFPPTSKEQCKKGGWRKFSLLAFKNQGQCVASTARRRGHGDDAHA
jgi:hypothetical protein